MNHENENMIFPVIRIQQPLGEFFAVSIRARVLREIVFLDPTRIESIDRKSFLYRLIGNQRPPSQSRAKSIANYINSEESAFPNSVILAANYNDKGAIIKNDPNRWKIEIVDKQLSLVIPSKSRMASVIDGQHRLMGFDHCKEERRDMEILCSVYIDLPLAYQAFLFATININQRKVNKSLAYEQFGYNLDEEEPKCWAPDKLAVFYTRRLNLKPDSPLYNHIKITPLDSDMVFPNDSESIWRVSTACIVESIMALFSSNPQRDRDKLHDYPISDRNRKNLPDDNSPLRDLFKSVEDEKIWISILMFLNRSHEFFWRKSENNSYIKKTVGIQGLFDVFRTLLRNSDDKNVEEELLGIFSESQKINFSNNFFQASGKGRVRVKRAILWAGGAISDDDLPSDELSEYQALLSS